VDAAGAATLSPTERQTLESVCEMLLPLEPCRGSRVWSRVEGSICRREPPAGEAPGAGTHTAPLPRARPRFDLSSPVC